MPAPFPASGWAGRAGVAVALALLVIAALAATAPDERGPVEEGAALERLATGFRFTEGPAVDRRGDIFFTDIHQNRIHKWTVATKTLSTVREQSQAANGLYIDGAGRLLACLGEGRAVVALDPGTGEASAVLADGYDGRRFNRPNDLWVDPKGGVYFTDPNYLEKPLQQDGEHVYYLAPDGGAVTRVISDMKRPNGVVGTKDGTALFVADAGAKKTYAYAIQPDGALTGKRLFVDSGSDGLTLDEAGNLYLTTDAVLVYSSKGERIGRIAVPEPPSNVCFGGPDGRTLFVTARTSLYAIRMQVRGMHAPAVSGAAER